MKVVQTELFTTWHRRLRDRRAAVKIDQRIKRLGEGNYGDARSVGDGVAELRIDYGPGYRIYFGRWGDAVVILLCGGDKSMQEKDIVRAKHAFDELKE